MIIILFLVVAVSMAQENQRAFNNGQLTVSAGYGIVNYWKILVKKGVTDNNYEATLKATGPFVIACEYGIFKRISVGVSLGYSKVKSTIPFGSYQQVTTLTNFSAIATANYHFFKSKRFDPYIGGGVGYYNFKVKNADDLGIVNVDFPDQVAVSSQLGCKYYFTPMFGAFVEAGYVGGALAQVGVTAKF